MAINTTKVNYQEPESNDKTIIEYKDGEGNLLYSANVKLISDLLKDNNLLKKEKINDLYRRLIFKLYEEEVDASETYQRLYNNSLTEFESVRTDIALKSLSEVRKDKIKYLEDQRNNVRQNYPFETFENVWNQKLQSDEFGKSKTFDEAVEYLTFKQVENDAKRRYEIEIKQQDLSFINRTAKRDIFKQDKNKQLD
ncbi:HinT-interacting membrane complex protein P80 [Mycoplasmopsis felis]|uniref:HinT-interacting membrane complex protein P80 n=1 Tax=Mycoplasmopsis felis TaxID=33923 RepID=UPI003A5C7A34